MAFYARDTYPSFSGTGPLSVSFSYLDEAHVHVYVDNVEVSFTWLTSSTIQLDAAVVDLDVVIARTTPLDVRVVDFQNAAQLSEKELDDSADQVFYTAQESSDLVQDIVSLEPDASLSMGGAKIHDMAAGTVAGDAVEYTQFKAQESALVGHLATGAAQVTACQDEVVLAQAEVSKAQDAVAKANEWAEKAEDSEVESGQYSALHHAAKAAASAASVDVQEAPEDGEQYARKDGAWEIVDTLEEADTIDWTGWHTHDQPVIMKELGATGGISASLMFQHDEVATTGNFALHNDSGELQILREVSGSWETQLLINSADFQLGDDKQLRVPFGSATLGLNNSGDSQAALTLFNGGNNQSVTLRAFNDNTYKLQGFGGVDMITGGPQIGQYLFHNGALKAHTVNDGLAVTGDLVVNGHLKNLDQYQLIAYGTFNGADATLVLTKDWGCDSITDNGTGQYTVNLTETWSAAGEEVYVMAYSTSIFGGFYIMPVAQGTDEVQFHMYQETTDLLADLSNVHFMVFKVAS